MQYTKVENELSVGVLYGKEGRENRKEAGGVLGDINDTVFTRLC